MAMRRRNLFAIFIMVALAIFIVAASSLWPNRQFISEGMVGDSVYAIGRLSGGRFVLSDSRTGEIVVPYNVRSVSVSKDFVCGFLEDPGPAHRLQKFDDLYGRRFSVPVGGGALVWSEEAE